MTFEDIFKNTMEVKQIAKDKVTLTAKTYKPMNFDVAKIIQHDPATVIYWADGEKTVVKRQGNEPWDAEKGIALCYMKRICGNKHSWYDTMLRLIRRAEGKKKTEKPKKITLDNDGILGYTCEYPTKE